MTNPSHDRGQIKENHSDEITNALAPQQLNQGAWYKEAKKQFSDQVSSWQNAIHQLGRAIEARWEDMGHVTVHTSKHINLKAGTTWRSIIDHEVTFPDKKVMEVRNLSFYESGGILTGEIKVHSPDRKQTLEVSAVGGTVSVYLNGDSAMDFDGTQTTESTARALNKISKLYLEGDLSTVPKTLDERLIRELDALGAVLRPEKPRDTVDLSHATLASAPSVEDGKFAKDARKSIENGATASWSNKANDVLYAVFAKARDAGTAIEHTEESHPSLMKGAKWYSVPDHTVSLPGGLTLEAKGFSFTPFGGCVGGELKVYRDKSKEGLHVYSNKSGGVGVSLGDQLAEDFDNTPLCHASSRVLAKVGSAYLDADVSNTPERAAALKLREQLDAF